jgi:D-alanine-D-alanine ligase
MFVKPSRAGSSLGIVRAAGPESLGPAVVQAGRHDPHVLIEAEVRGREIECAVLGGRPGKPARAAVPGEIVVTGGHEFYDFAAKYTDPHGVQLICPADLPARVVQDVRTMAVQAFSAIGCEGLARVDFFYRDDPGPGEAELVINEVNTMPGLTQFSMYPKMWAAAGLPYRDLVAELIDLALTRPVGLR